MKLSVDLPDIKEVIKATVDCALKDCQSKFANWKYFTLKETADLLQIKTSTLLDKRMPYLNEIEHSQNGRLFWFAKKSVEDFIAKRTMKKYTR